MACTVIVGTPLSAWLSCTQHITTTVITAKAAIVPRIATFAMRDHRLDINRSILFAAGPRSLLEKRAGDRFGDATGFHFQNVAGHRRIVMGAGGDDHAEAGVAGGPHDLF